VGVGLRRVLLWVAAVLCVATSARAERVALRWIAPEVCPDDGEMRRDVEQLLGRPLEWASSEQLTVRGEVARSGATWIVHLELAAPEGTRTRELTGQSCAEVSAAAALVIALAVDPAVETGTTEPAPPRAAPEATTHADTSEPPAPARPSRPHRTRKPKPAGPAWTVGASGSIDARSLPAPAPGVEVKGAARWPSLRMELGLAYYPGQRRELRSGAGGEFDLTFVSLRGCPQIRVGRIESALCLESDLGVLAGSGVGVRDAADGSSPWWTLGGGLHVGWWVTPALLLTTGGDVLGILSRDEFVLARVGLVYRPPAVTARWTLGAEVRLW
jgi:hypothetical protein